MAKQRYINTKIWEDAWFSNLDQIEQLVFIYFLTNPMTNIVGVYELSKATIGRAVGLERITLDEILRRFEVAKKVFYIDGWVVLPNFIKHQNYNSPTIRTGIEVELAKVPKTALNLINIPYPYRIDTLSHLNTNLNTNIIHSETSSLTAKSKKTNDDFLLLIRKYKEGYEAAIGGELTPFSFSVARKKFNEALKLGYKATDLENYLPLFFESKFYEKTNWSLRSFLSEGTLGILKKEYE